MRRGLAASSFAVAIAAAAAGCATAPAPLAARSHPSANPTVVTTRTPPKSALQALKRQEHATYVAGPEQGPAGLFAALGFVPSMYCCRDPHDRLVFLRWDGHRWEYDGKLTAVHSGRNYWDFPFSGLLAHPVAGASAEAPVFLGAVNGTYPAADMLAVRTGGHWQWARFIGCDVLTGCRGKAEPSWIVGNGYFRNDHLLGSVPTCKPSCAYSRVVYDESWSWSADKQAFVLARVKKVISAQTQ